MLGISVVTLDLCLHDTWSQNMSLEMQALPVSRNCYIFMMELLMILTELKIWNKKM